MLAAIILLHRLSRIAATTLVIAVSVCAIAAHAQDSQDAGLDGRRYRLGLGLSANVYDDNGTDSPLQGSLSSEFLAADYTYFRPTRQEALATLWFAHGRWNLDGQSARTALGAATSEYRWRFFGHGIGYVAAGAGLSQTGFRSSGIKFDTTVGIGVDLGRFYIADRALDCVGGDLGVEALFVGVRF